MEFKVGEIIKMKKKHPCGANEWKLLRVGMDFRLQCMNCGREVMVPRKLVEKNFRGYIKKSDYISSIGDILKIHIIAK